MRRMKRPQEGGQSRCSRLRQQAARILRAGASMNEAQSEMASSRRRSGADTPNKQRFAATQPRRPVTSRQERRNTARGRTPADRHTPAASSAAALLQESQTTSVRSFARPREENARCKRAAGRRTQQRKKRRGPTARAPHGAARSSVATRMLRNRRMRQ